MSKIESISSHHHLRGPLEVVSADKRVRHYGGIWPITVIDLPSEKDDLQSHLTLNSFTSSEFNLEGDPDTLRMSRGNHASVLFSFIAVQGNGSLKYRLISPDGYIGDLETDEIDAIPPYLASLFHDHPEHSHLSSGVSVDASVLDYLSKRTGFAVNQPIFEVSEDVA